MYFGLWNAFLQKVSEILTALTYTYLYLRFIGVDIPEVDYVLQFDPPSNAEAFVHRCGRTARSGNKGQAVVFLLPTEKSYVEFIALNQKVDLQEMAVSDFMQDLPNLLPILRDWQKNDRTIFDMANRAFVSHIQSYSKHECKYILRLKGTFHHLCIWFYNEMNIWPQLV